MTRLRAALLAATICSAGSAAFAQAAGTAAFDSQQLPAVKGRVALYSLTPRGDVDGLILEDGTQVHLPPHLGPQLAVAVKPGDAVTVYGLGSRAIPVMQAVQVVNDATGRAVTDSGPSALPPAPGPDGSRTLDEQGKVKATLYGPLGDVNGALMEDGTQIHLPPSEAQRLAALLVPGQVVVLRGVGVESTLGRAIDVQMIGPSRLQMVQVAPPPPPPPGGPGMAPPPPPPPGGPGMAPPPPPPPPGGPGMAPPPPPPLGGPVAAPPPPPDAANPGAAPRSAATPMAPGALPPGPPPPQ